MPSGVPFPQSPEAEPPHAFSYWFNGQAKIKLTPTHDLIERG